MAEILVEVAPLDPVSGSRVTLRLSSIDHRNVNVLNGVRWWPAITRRPRLSADLFDGDFLGEIAVGSAALSINLQRVAKRIDSNVARFRWSGSSIKIWASSDPDAAWGSWDQVFDGEVKTVEIDGLIATVAAEVSTSAFDVDMLTLSYAGTGGAEGPASLKNRPKPFCAGSVVNVEPILIDVANSVYQMHGYGPINGTTEVFENGASFGSSLGDFASYAALVAATIPPGRWATCNASGLIRLGAPPREGAVITLDAGGDKPSTFLRKTGEIINRLCTLAGVPAGNIDSSSLAALDSAVPRNIRFYVDDQVKLIEFIQSLARPCNAAAGISWLGDLFVCRSGFGSSALTLDAQGKAKPTVAASVELAVSSPYYRYEMLGERVERPHEYSEIAFSAELIEVGTYSASTTYREGNIVSDQGARWVYVNPSATSGNAPPTLPTESNSYWDLLSPAPDAADISGLGALAYEDAAITQELAAPYPGVPGTAWTNPATGLVYVNIGTGLLIGSTQVDIAGTVVDMVWSAIPQVDWSGDVSGTVDGRDASVISETITNLGTIGPGKIVASSLSADIITQVLSASGTSTVPTDGGVEILRFSDVKVMPSQGGYFHAIISAMVGVPSGAGAGFGSWSPLDSFSCSVWLQRATAGSTDWTFLSSQPLFGVSGDGTSFDVNPPDEDYVLLGYLPPVRVSATAQFVDVPAADGLYDYRWVASKVSTPGSLSSPETYPAEVFTAQGIGISTKVAA